MLNQNMKWSTNPCGNLWAKDSSKFGQKILEKFGWTPGKGLGVNEQGIVAPIRLKCNSTQKGLGYERGNRTEIFQHQEEFNLILSSLNSSENLSAQSEGTAKRPSLEEKSKNCKTRVHYHKFTRGKDLSRYSEKDLSCILGVFSSLKHNVSPSEEINSCDVTENPGTSPLDCLVNNNESVTIDEGRSNDGDVRKKVKKKNKKRKINETGVDYSKTSHELPPGDSHSLLGDDELKQNEVINSLQPKSIKSSSKKKIYSEASTVSSKLASNYCDTSVDKYEIIANDIVKPRNKKMKHK